MVQLKFVINFKLNIIKILLLYHKKRKYNDYEVCSSLKTIASSLSIEHSSINHFSLLVCGIPFLTLFMMPVSVVGSIGFSVVLSLFLFIISMMMSSVFARIRAQLFGFNQFSYFFCFSFIYFFKSSFFSCCQFFEMLDVVFCTEFDFVSFPSDCFT